MARVKKSVKFDKWLDEAIQKIADKYYNKNFSLAVREMVRKVARGFKPNPRSDLLRLLKRSQRAEEDVLLSELMRSVTEKQVHGEFNLDEIETTIMEGSKSEATKKAFVQLFRDYNENKEAEGLKDFVLARAILKKRKQEKKVKK